MPGHYACLSRAEYDEAAGRERDRRETLKVILGLVNEAGFATTDKALLPLLSDIKLKLEGLLHRVGEPPF